MKKIRLALIASDLNHGIAHIRGHQVFRELDPNRYEIYPIAFNDLKHWHVQYYDVFVFIHSYGDEVLKVINRITNNYNRPVIIDLDDLLSEMPTDHPHYHHFQDIHIDEIVSCATTCVFSTVYLRAYYSHLNKHTHVIENTISLDHYRKALKFGKPATNNFAIGWTGSDYHQGDVYNTFYGALNEFMADFNDAHFYTHLVCPNKLQKDFGHRIHFKSAPVDYFDYAIYSSQYPFDVCLVGLEDIPFNHAKSDLRLLDMGVFGIPCLASPVTPFIPHQMSDPRRCLTTKDNSMFAWYEALKDCYRNQDLLRDVGDHAREYVMSQRTSRSAAYQWEKVLGETLDRYHQGQHT